MSVKTTYTCNLCRKEIDKGKDAETGVEHGFALVWKRDFANKKEVLEMTPDWINCPFHLCFDCIDAVADFRKTLKDMR